MRVFKLFFITFTIFILSATINIHGQNYSLGGGIGLGSFFGDFPSQSTLNGKFYFEFSSPLSVFDKLDVSASFGQKIEKFLPDSYNYKHYPHFKSFGFSGKFNQSLNEFIYIQEGIGLIYFNDRSFSDIDKWNLGILLSISSGLPISNNFDLLLNGDYGLTFTNTNSSYISFVLLVTYSFY